MTHLKARHFQWTEFIVDSDLPPHSKYLCLYLALFMNTKQNLAWPSLARIQKETGLTKPTIIKYLDKAEEAGFLTVERTDDFKTNNKYHAKMPEEVLNLINQGSKGDLPPPVKDVYQGGKGGLPGVVKELNPNNQYNNQGNNQRSLKHVRFKAPTPQQVKAYAKEKGIVLDHEDFCDFYESKGWMVGKNKMKNWKSAASRWARSNSNRGNQNGNGKAGRFSAGAHIAKELRRSAEKEIVTDIRDIN